MLMNVFTGLFAVVVAADGALSIYYAMTERPWPAMLLTANFLIIGVIVQLRLPQ